MEIYKLYLDANPFIALVWRESGRNLEFMDQAFEQFIEVCEEKGYVLVLSDLFFYEVEKLTKMDKKEVLDVLDSLDIRFVETKPQDRKKAYEFQKEYEIPYKDALHAQLALKMRCHYIVSWDSDFDLIKKKIKRITPRDIIY